MPKLEPKSPKMATVKKRRVSTSADQLVRRKTASGQGHRRKLNTDHIGSDKMTNAQTDGITITNNSSETGNNQETNLDNFVTGQSKTALDKTHQKTSGESNSDKKNPVKMAPDKTDQITTDESGPDVMVKRESNHDTVSTEGTWPLRKSSRVVSATSSNAIKDDEFDDEIITLNIGGLKHQTKLATISQFPNTRLAKLAEAARLTGKREYFFDRHPSLFSNILNFYRTGKLHVPISLCGPLLREELDFWEIDDKDIQQCCWVHYISFEDTLEMIEKFEQDDMRVKNSVKNVGTDAPCWSQYRPKMWRALQDPYSSKGATAYAVSSLLVVLLSISVFILETLPYFEALTVHATSARANITSEMLRKELDIFYDITPYDVLLIIDNSCNVFFFTEFLVKLMTSPSKKDFLTTPLTIIEAICIVPYYIAVTIIFLHPDPVSIFEFIRVLFAFRVLRIFRIFILMKHFLALKILIYTIKASTKELCLLLLVVMIGVVIFACIEYYMEIFTTEDSDFKHIPLAFWWAIVTMTTVGYGDMTPKTGLGYLVGSVCAISGVLVIALSVPAIVNNFTLYYTHAQSREKLKLRKRKFQKQRWNKLMSTTVLKMKFCKSEDRVHAELKTMANGLVKHGVKGSSINSVTPVNTEEGSELNGSMADGCSEGLGQPDIKQNGDSVVTDDLNVAAILSEEESQMECRHSSVTEIKAQLLESPPVEETSPTLVNVLGTKSTETVVDSGVGSLPPVEVNNPSDSVVKGQLL